jgi:hypothetical protein
VNYKTGEIVMIHIGLKLYPEAIKTVALAAGLEPVAKLFCNARHIQRLHHWLKNIKYESNDNIIAFVDEFEFNLYKCHYRSIFFDTDYFQKIYLVKHRLCAQWMIVLMGYQAFELHRPVRVNKAFLLACSAKIIPKKHLHIWNPEDDLPF